MTTFNRIFRIWRVFQNSIKTKGFDLEENFVNITCYLVPRMLHSLAKLSSPIFLLVLTNFVSLLGLVVELIVGSWMLKQPPEVFYKKVFLIISQNSQENIFARISFLAKLRAEACNFIKKRDSDTAVFLWILRTFEKYLLYRTPLDDCFCGLQARGSLILIRLCQ